MAPFLRILFCNKESRFLMKTVTALSILLISFIMYSCATVPVTGRSQLAVLPDSELNAMAFQQYDSVIRTAELSDNRQQAAMVKEVGNKIKNAVQKYMRDNNLRGELDGYKWEFNLIEDDDVVNAWCMPGGKVAFYTGIMPICKDENGVAVVMGHEVAHAIARHGNERMSQGLFQQLGGVALSVALRNSRELTQQLLMTAYGAGSTVGVMLPFSRLHESEADRMGLIFMAMAGYDPREAPEFWRRMASTSQGGQPPEFLSTHPSHERRIADLQAAIPEAMEYYRK